jgi:hypothetical protein
MEMVRIHSMQDYAALPVNAWGYREPDWSNRSLELGIYFIFASIMNFSQKQTSSG